MPGQSSQCWGVIRLSEGAQFSAIRSRHNKEVWRECFVTNEDDCKGF